MIVNSCSICLEKSIICLVLIIFPFILSAKSHSYLTILIHAIKTNDTLFVLFSCCVKRELSTTDAAEQVGVAVAGAAVQQRGSFIMLYVVILYFQLLRKLMF